LIVLDATNNEIPISSGKGDAIIKPAKTGIKYFLNKLGVLFLISMILLSFDNLSISSANEYLTKLKIIKSPTRAPKPPITPAKKIFCSFAKINKIAVAGAAVKP